MVNFWRTFHHDGKISPGWWREGGRGAWPHPFTLQYLPSRTKLVCTLQLKSRHTPRISFQPCMYSMVETQLDNGVYNVQSTSIAYQQTHCHPTRGFQRPSADYSQLYSDNFGHFLGRLSSHGGPIPIPCVAAPGAINNPNSQPNPLCGRPWSYQ